MQSQIEKAAELLRDNQLVAFPTETVYGLGGNALSDTAVARIYAAKCRPQFNPLIVHVASLEEAQRYVECNDNALLLARRFWPGPLTLVLPRKKNCALSLLVSAGLDCVALRVPAHPLALELLKLANLPLAAPSANRSGKISPTLASHVREEFGDAVPMILDGGACAIGLESTVLDLTGDKPLLLRAGGVTLEKLEAVLGSKLCLGKTSDIKSPGQLESHYAPSKPVRINATYIEDGEMLLAFGDALGTLNLSPSGNLEEAAANLFRMLRELDAMDAKTIAVSPIPEVGLGIAINDRLKRAAAPRS